MKTEIEFDDRVMATIKQEADDLGLTIAEVIRLAVGIHAYEPRRHQLPPPPRALLQITPPPLRLLLEQLDPIERAFFIANRLLLRRIIKSGDIKCPNCTLPLSFESLQEGQCSNCKAKLEE